jgi:hypothetical protein
MKFGMSFMPLEATPTFYFFISYNWYYKHDEIKSLWGGSDTNKNLDSWNEICYRSSRTDTVILF